jgi:hypothetical protein
VLLFKRPWALARRRRCSCELPGTQKHSWASRDKSSHDITLEQGFSSGRNMQN